MSPFGTNIVTFRMDERARKKKVGHEIVVGSRYLLSVFLKCSRSRRFLPQIRDLSCMQRLNSPSPRQRMRLGEESSVLGDTPQLYSTSFPRITPVFLNPFKSAPALFPPSGAGIAPLAAVPPPLLCPCIISSNYKLSPKLTAVSLNSSACLVLSLS